MQLETVSINKLRPHKLNNKIYINEIIDKDFIESVKRGIRQNIIVNQDYVILSGHRRHSACLQAGISEVLVEVKTFDSPEDEEEFLLDCNKTREKSKEVKLREYEHYKKIEEERLKKKKVEEGKKARDKQLESTKQDEPALSEGFQNSANPQNKERQDETGVLQNFAKPQNNPQQENSRIIASKKVDISLGLAEKGEKILKAIDILDKKKQNEAAKLLRYFLEKEATDPVYKMSIALLDKETYEDELARLKAIYSRNQDDLNEGVLTLKNVKSQEKTEKLEQKKQEIIQKESESVKDNKPIAYNKDAVSFLNTFEDNSIDILMTDPPYSTDIKDIKSFAFEWVTLALSKVKKEGRGYICIGAYPIELHSYLDVFLNQDKFILDNPLIWTYRNTLGVTPKDKYNLNYQVILHFYSKESKQLDTSITNEMFSVQDINAPDGRQGDRLHTWQKPIELANRFVRHSSKPNDLLVDPFCCTGTFLIAGSTYNCKSIGNDLSIENLKIAESRGIELAN